MKIVVLDGYTANPGDLSWAEMEKLGEVSIHDRTPPELVIERAKDAQIVLTNKTALSDEIFAQLPKLKYVGVLATGYNVVDIVAANARGITVTNIPAYSTDSVAQLVFAFILNHCTHANKHNDAVHNGDWVNAKDFCFWNYPLVELAGKTLGIVGFGRIGRKVAEIAFTFGLNVIGYDTNATPFEHEGFKWASLDELLLESDFVSLHCPLFPDTQGLINKDRLSKMKKSALLINTSRGPLVDENDLSEALNNGLIAGAALDVLSVEPPKADNPLLTAKNCLITPHIAWATKEARGRLLAIAADNVRQFLDGRAVNVVDLF